MKAREMVLPVYEITGPEGRVNPSFLLSLRASPSHNMTDTDWEPSLFSGFGMVNVPDSSASQGPWQAHNLDS